MGAETSRCERGIPTGKRSGFVVVDLDKKGSVDGIAGYQTLLDALGIDPPATYRVKTPTGGEHIYLQTKSAGRIRNSASLLGAGIDVRGEGGYVLGAGSSIDGTKYRRVSGSLDSIALLPKALRRKLMTKKRKRHGNGRGKYKTGTRNNSLYRDASTLRADGHSYEEVLDSIRSLNLNACQPPLDDTDVLTIVESAFKGERIDPVEEALTVDRG